MRYRISTKGRRAVQVGRARGVLRRFMKRVTRRDYSNGLLRARPVGIARLRQARFGTGYNLRRGGRPSINNIRFRRDSVKTGIYNASTSDDLSSWLNIEAGQSSLNNLPFYWQQASGSTYASFGSSVSHSSLTEGGSSATGGAGALIRARMRFTLGDIPNATDLLNWERIKLDYVTVHFRYIRTEYSAGNDASGITPSIDYLFDNDGPIDTPQSNASLAIKPNVRRMTLPPNVTKSIKVKPMAYFAMVNQPGTSGTYVSSACRPLGYVDPAAASSLNTPFSNFIFHVRNMQLPNGVEAQTSCLQIWATYHYTCKLWQGAAAS